MIVYASFARSFFMQLLISILHRFLANKSCVGCINSVSVFPHRKKKQNKKLFTNLSGHLCIRVVCVRLTTNNYCLGCLIS